MAKKAADGFEAIRKAGTAAPNFELTTEAIVKHLAGWRALCAFRVMKAGGDRIDIEFETLPADMDAFVKDLYAFCPDLVDQGTGCVHEMVEAMEEMGEELSPEMKQLIEGVDFGEENYGLTILKRELERGRKIMLWWD